MSKKLKAKPAERLHKWEYSFWSEGEDDTLWLRTCWNVLSSMSSFLYSRTWNALITWSDFSRGPPMQTGHLPIEEMLRELGLKKGWLWEGWPGSCLSRTYGDVGKNNSLQLPHKKTGDWCMAGWWGARDIFWNKTGSNWKERETVSTWELLCDGVCCLNCSHSWVWTCPWRLLRSDWIKLWQMW